MTAPTPDISPGDELEQILDDHAVYYIRQTMKFFQNEGESPALSKNNDGDLVAKDRLNRLMLTERRKELERLRPLVHPYDGNDMVADLINDAIKAIDAQLNKEETR